MGIFIVDEFGIGDNEMTPNYMNERQLPIKEIAYYLDRIGFNVYIKGHGVARKYGKFTSGYFGSKGLQELASKCSYVIGRMSSVIIEALNWDCIPILVDHLRGTNYRITSTVDKHIYNYNRTIILGNPVREHMMSNVFTYIPGITKKMGSNFNKAMEFILKNRDAVLRRIKNIWLYKNTKSFYKTVLDYIENEGYDA